MAHGCIEMANADFKLPILLSSRVLDLEGDGPSTVDFLIDIQKYKKKQYVFDISNSLT